MTSYESLLDEAAELLFALADDLAYYGGDAASSAVCDTTDLAHRIEEALDHD